jgi:hypothetical protein
VFDSTSIVAAGVPSPVETVWVGVVLLNRAFRSVEHSECLVGVGGEDRHGRSLSGIAWR